MPVLDQLYIGWVCTRWTHWEPVTLPPREIVAAAQLLHLHMSFDPDDGDKVLLPEELEPVPKRRQQ